MGKRKLSIGWKGKRGHQQQPFAPPPGAARLFAVSINSSVLLFTDIGQQPEYCCKLLLFSTLPACKLLLLLRALENCTGLGRTNGCANTSSALRSERCARDHNRHTFRHATVSPAWPKGKNWQDQHGRRTAILLTTLPSTYNPNSHHRPERPAPRDEQAVFFMAGLQNNTVLEGSPSSGTSPVLGPLTEYDWYHTSLSLSANTTTPWPWL